MADFQDQSSIEHESTQKKVASLDLELSSKIDLEKLNQITNQFILQVSIIIHAFTYQKSANFSLHDIHR